MKYEYGETLGDLEPVYDLFPITSEFTLAEAVTVLFFFSFFFCLFFFFFFYSTPPAKHEYGKTRVRVGMGGGGVLGPFETRYRLTKAVTQNVAYD